MGRRGILLGLIVSVFLLVGSASAFATAVYPDGGTTPTTVVVEGKTAVAPAATADPSQTLPFTGGDVAGLAGIGVGAIAVGLLLTRRASRRRA